MGIIWSCWKKPDVLYVLYFKIVAAFCIFFLYLFNNMAKSLSRQSWQKDSPFTKQIFITKHAAFYNTTVLRRLFILKLNVTYNHLIPKPRALQRLVNRFGDVWAAIVRDSIFRLRWMDEAHWPPTVTGASYLAVVKVWPGLRRACLTEAVVAAAGWRMWPLHRRCHHLSQWKVPRSGDQWSGASGSIRGCLSALQPFSLNTTSWVSPMPRWGDSNQWRLWWKKWQRLSTARFFVQSWRIFGKGRTLVSQWKEDISNMH